VPETSPTGRAPFPELQHLSRTAVMQKKMSWPQFYAEDLKIHEDLRSRDMQSNRQVKSPFRV
jgi:hypothetical protein